MTTCVSLEKTSISRSGMANEKCREVVRLNSELIPILVESGKRYGFHQYKVISDWIQKCLGAGGHRDECKCKGKTETWRIWKSVTRSTLSDPTFTARCLLWVSHSCLQYYHMRACLRCISKKRKVSEDSRCYATCRLTESV